ncbi:MAG: ATPase [Gemmatimonadetes bacterium]|nr:ATPase [Gemmatimonadota bacterium]
MTVLSPRGTPTPVVATLMVPPASQMTPMPEAELASAIRSSPLHGRYAQAIDRESAREVLQARAAGRPAEAAAPGRGAPRPPEEPGIAETAGKILNSPMARTVGRELVRGLFAVLGVRSITRRRR